MSNSKLTYFQQQQHDVCPGADNETIEGCQVFGQRLDSQTQTNARR